MDKYEHYALGHYLSGYPDDWDYDQVIDELENGNQERFVDVHCLYEEMPPEDLAVIINDMTKSLRSYFK